MMELFGRDLETEIAIIAEVGVNHGGSIPWILDFLIELKNAGVDAAKFQLFTKDYHTSRNNIARLDFLQRVNLTRNDFLKIVEFSSSIGLKVFASAITHDWVDFISDNCGVVKIASGDFTFQPIIRKALESDARVLASTGGTSMLEIESFLEHAHQIRGRLECEKTVALLHCISSYPPPLEECNLRAIPEIKSKTRLSVGFSSHFMEDAPLYSAHALGARIFEIHATDDRARLDIRDHALSRTPTELAKITNELRLLDTALKVEGKEIQPSELESLSLIRKGLIYSKDLTAGSILSVDDFAYARPLNTSVGSIESLIGKRLKRAVKSHYSVEIEDLIP